MLEGLKELKNDIKNIEDKEGDIYDQMEAGKVDRARLKAEKQLMKEKQDRSQGEMALAFMGINQIAN
jgi:hypothetical protein